MPQRRLFVSDSFAVLQAAFVTAVQAVKNADPLMPLTVLIPNDLLGLRLRRAVAQAGAGHLGLSAYTLSDFAWAIAADTLAQEGWQPLLPHAAFLIMSKVLREEETNHYFAPLAAQPRFPRVLLETIADLKQAGVHPQDLHTFSTQAQLTGTYRHKVDSLSALYERYMRFSTEHSLYDEADLLGRATTLLTSLQETVPLFLYGCFDLSPLQRRLLAAAFQERDVLVFFSWREGAAYEHATPTLTWLTGLGLQYTPLAGIPGPESDLAHMQRWLFEDRPSHARRGARASLQETSSSLSARAPETSQHSWQPDNSLVVISAPNQSREVREICRTIVTLVRNEGLRFHDIAILLQDPATYGPLLAQTLTGFTIPYVLSTGVPLIQTRAGQSVHLLCQVVAEEYARSRLCEFLAVADPPFAELLGDLSRYVRLDRWQAFSLEAGIVRGATEWQERLLRLAGNLAGTEAERTEVLPDEDRPVLHAFVAFMQGFLATCEQMPRVNTFSGWAEHTLRLLRMYVAATSHTAEVEEELIRLGSLDVIGEPISAQEWCKNVAAALTAARRELSPDRGTSENEEGVWIGDLRAAQGMQFRAVIVPGVNEGSLPRTARQDPVLLDAERQHLGEILLRQLPQRGRRDEEQRLLFTLTTQSATERLILTYPRFRQDGGYTQVPSPYLFRITETFSADADLEQWTVHVPALPFHAGSPQTAMDVIEFHFASVEQALTTDSSVPLGYLPAITPFLSRAFHMAQQRWDTPTLTVFDGIIEDSATRALLHRYLFPTETVLSASALETYARCPFRYFLSAILGLTPQEKPEHTSPISPRDRGALLHDILSDFFTRLRETGQFPLADQDYSALMSLLIQVTEQRCQVFAGTKATGFPLMWELEQERLHERLAVLLRQECDARDGFLPTAFEAHFGMETADKGHPFFPQSPVRFFLENGEEIGLRGRIDRIDLLVAHQRARIYDYKTGKPVRGRFAGGTALQLPLYLFAARTLRPDLLWESAEYLYIDHPNRKPNPLFTDGTWAESLATLRTIVTMLVQGIQSGCFAATPSSCHSCPFPTICGRQAEFFAAGKLNDPRLDPLRQVGAVP
jgi:ATP-dependent helicase/nuclease subunit B